MTCLRALLAVARAPAAPVLPNPSIESSEHLGGVAIGHRGLERLLDINTVRSWPRPPPAAPGAGAAVEGDRPDAHRWGAAPARGRPGPGSPGSGRDRPDRKSTRLNSSHV